MAIGEAPKLSDSVAGKPDGLTPPDDAPTALMAPEHNDHQRSMGTTSTSSDNPGVPIVTEEATAIRENNEVDVQVTNPESGLEPRDTAHLDAHRSLLKRNDTTREDGDLNEKPRVGEFNEELLAKDKESVSDFYTCPELYEIYVQKLQKLNKTSSAVKEKEKTPTLVRSLIDYLSHYEERVGKLEDKVGLGSKDKWAKESTSPDVAGTKFYNVDDFGHAGVEASNEEEDEWNVKGAFCSTVDGNHCIRALWKTKPNGETSGTVVPPNPELVDILEIRIKGKPIAIFFEKELDYNISQDGLIHLAKPFRFLIRKVDRIRDHVSRLEGKHSGLVTSTSLPSATLIEDEDTKNAHDTPGPSLTASTADASSQDLLESQEALAQFKELLDFADSYLAADISRFREYQKGTRTSIAFDNLWMLFDSNITIYCPLKKGECKIYDEQDKEADYFETQEAEVPQVYRVLGTLGGIARNPTTPVDSQFGKRQKKSPSTQVSYPQGNVAKHIREKCTSLFLDCYFIGFDGVQFRAIADSFEFKPFQGELPVTSLEVYPICYYYNTYREAGSALAERGCHYVDLTSVQHVSHKGHTLGERKEEINGPVIVDFKAAYQHESQWKPSLSPGHIIKWLFDQKSILEIPKRTCSHTHCHKTSCLQDVAIAQQKGCLDKGFRDINIFLDDYNFGSQEQIERFKEDMRSHDLLSLLPGTAYAFALRSRKWVKVALKNLGTVKHEDNWDDLVLPSGHKDMVQALVETHASTGSSLDITKDNYEVDLVPGKGKGCIILLHGEPGVGKTSTAECVAAYTKRPLYPITCGDIGATPKEVEESLDVHFTRAHKWGCVLLLDEADVFLAKRNRSGDDIKRNGLVSVFLRTLEYYSGILFLTTNRVGAFDSAFRSRIHVMLHYPKLKKEQAVKIWETNISRLDRHNEDRRNKNLPEIEIKGKKILKFAKKNFENFKWNGRQIRNAFQTAIALAEFEARQKEGKSPKVTTKHFDKVALATAEFDEYLRELYGLDEEKMAKRNVERTPYTAKPGRAKSLACSDDSSSSESSESSDEESSSDDSDDLESPTEAKSKRSKKKKQKEKGEKRKKELEKENKKKEKT